MKFKKLPNQGTSIQTKRQVIEYLHQAETALLREDKKDEAFYVEMIRESLNEKMDKVYFDFETRDLGL